MTKWDQTYDGRFCSKSACISSHVIYWCVTITQTKINCKTFTLRLFRTFKILTFEPCIYQWATVLYSHTRTPRLSNVRTGESSVVPRLRGGRMWLVCWKLGHWLEFLALLKDFRPFHLELRFSGWSIHRGYFRLLINQQLINVLIGRSSLRAQRFTTKLLVLGDLFGPGDLVLPLFNRRDCVM